MGLAGPDLGEWAAGAMWVAGEGLGLGAGLGVGLGVGGKCAGVGAGAWGSEAAEGGIDNSCPAAGVG